LAVSLIGAADFIFFTIFNKTFNRR